LIHLLYLCVAMLCGEKPLFKAVGPPRRNGSIRRVAQLIHRWLAWLE
jgi:hypothetical protein